MAFTEQEYKFSPCEAFKAIKWLWIPFVLSFVEILFLEFDCGFHILNEQFAAIVSQICYAFLTSSIFYYFVETLPSLKSKFYATQNNARKKYYQNEIISRKLHELRLQYELLNHFLQTRKFPELNEEPLKKEFSKRLKSESTWNMNLKRLKNSSDRILNIIHELLLYNMIINESLLNELDEIVYKIQHLRIEDYYDEENEPETFVILFCDIYQIVLSKLNEITKEDFRKRV